MFCASCEGLLAFETSAAAPGRRRSRPRPLRRAPRIPTIRATAAACGAIANCCRRFRSRGSSRCAKATSRSTMRRAAHGGTRGVQAADVHRLHLGMNPTASFKDAGMTVAISRAAAAGARVAICASTGNTSASLAAYAARAGMHALVLVPSTGISASKVAQTLDYGATVVAIDGDFDAALVTVRADGSEPRCDRQLRQSVPHRGPEDGGVRHDGTARLARARLGRVAGRQSRQHQRAR